MQKKHQLKLLLLTALTVASLSAKPALAQTGTPIDIAVTPPIHYVYLKPGEKRTYQVAIEQRGSVPLAITPTITDFSSDGKTGQPVLGNGSQFRYISLTLPAEKIDTTSFRLNPGEKKTVAFTIDIPENAAENEYHLTLLFRAKADKSSVLTNTDDSEVTAVIGSNLIALVSATDRDRSNIQLEKISTTNLIDSLGSISFTLLARNTGQNANVASGSASITDWRGNQVAHFPVYPDMILAQSTRELRTAPSLDEALDTPETISNDFTYDSLFLIGLYTINAELLPTTEGGAVSTLTLTVIAFPFSILLVVTIIIFLICIYYFLAQKHTIIPRQVLEEPS